jgi:hypothetical protein
MEGQNPYISGNPGDPAGDPGRSGIMMNIQPNSSKEN